MAAAVLLQRRDTRGGADLQPGGLGGYHWAIVPDQSMRWYILDSDEGVLIVDIEDGPDGLSHDELLQTGTEIVESFAFSSPS